MRDDVAIDEETEHTARTPELRLVAAVFELGVRDATAPPVPNGSKARKLGSYGAHDSARRWLDSDREGAFSFRWCCYQLGFDPDVLRTALVRRERKVHAALLSGGHCRYADRTKRLP